VAYAFLALIVGISIGRFSNTLRKTATTRIQNPDLGWIESQTSSGYVVIFGGPDKWRTVDAKIK
jgi:hypothetical protein